MYSLDKVPVELDPILCPGDELLCPELNPKCLLQECDEPRDDEPRDDELREKPRELREDNPNFKDAITSAKKKIC